MSLTPENRLNILSFYEDSFYSKEADVDKILESYQDFVEEGIVKKIHTEDGWTIQFIASPRYVKARLNNLRFWELRWCSKEVMADILRGEEDLLEAGYIVLAGNEHGQMSFAIVDKPNEHQGDVPF